MTRLAQAVALHLLIGVLAAGCAEGTPQNLDPDASVDPDGSQPPDGAVDPAGVGAPCLRDLDCGDGMTCLKAYVSYAEPDVGMIIPRSYCTYTASCETDADCGEGAGCWRPLEGVPEGELGALDFDPEPLVDFGQCLVACEHDDECGDGFVCQKPLLRALAPLESAPERRFCVFDDTPRCDDSMRAPSAGKCTLTYALEGSFEITDTLGGQGDTVRPIGPGTLVLEVASSGGPSAGAARVKCYEMDQRMQVEFVHTAVRASFASPTSATGTITGGALVFDECNYHASRGVDATSWTLESPAEGPGCLADYASIGGVFCDNGSFVCSIGDLAAGSNPQDNRWTQPFNTLDFTGTTNWWDAVAMGGAEQLRVGGALVDACETSPCPAEEYVEVPNENRSRTWLSFTGTLAEQRCN